MTVDWKKVLILNLPYLLFVYLFDKLCQAVRLAPGLDASEKFLHLSQGFTEAFSSGLPSLHPLDLLVGIAGAVIVRLEVYAKGQLLSEVRTMLRRGAPKLDENGKPRRKVIYDPYRIKVLNTINFKRA